MASGTEWRVTAFLHGVGSKGVVSKGKTRRASERGKDVLANRGNIRYLSNARVVVK